ncbi:arginine ABC transporter permease ArtQ, partial [Vibrio echinoideorum]
SLIGVTDLLKQAQFSSAAPHDAFTGYATAAAIYLVITLITLRLVKVIDGKFSILGLGNKGAMA